MKRELQQGGTRIMVYEDSFNKRIRVDDYSGPLAEVFVLIRKQIKPWTEKLIVKARSGHLPFFIGLGFTCEGFIRGYFSGADMYFAVTYFSPVRGISKKWSEEQILLEKILNTGKVGRETIRTEVIRATEKEAPELASLYAAVFPIYPTPVEDPDYIKKTMKEGTLYLCIRESGKIVSAASAEIDNNFRNAELTDCASLEEVQGKGHMKCLIQNLEKNLVSQGITHLYTLARAESFGMNKVFYQSDYAYGGRLINNCFIYSGLEDMNVWYKTA